MVTSRALVERSLPFLREQGLAWIDKRDCTSCHQVPAMLWSWNLATAAGIVLYEGLRQVQGLGRAPRGG